MLFEWYFYNYCLIRKIRGDNYRNLYRNLFEREVLRYPRAYQLAGLRFLYTVLKLSWGCPTPFYMLSHLPTSSAIRLNSSCSTVLLPQGGVIQPRFICYRIYQSHLQLNSSHHAVLLSHKKSGEDAKHRKSRAFHRTFWAWGRLCRPQGTVPNRSRTVCRMTGVVMDWSNKSDEIYFNHFYYDKTTKTACFTCRTTPHPNSHPTQKHKKKNSSSANTWVLVNKNPAPCYSPTVKFAVPSPLRSLTTVFGKGTCVTTSLWAPEKNQIKKIKSIKSNIRTILLWYLFHIHPGKREYEKKGG